MPTVPGLLPSVAPIETGVPKLGVTADANAFGANVGQALGHLGQAVSHASDEIWNRAVALQQLRNESEAKEADAQFMIQSAKLRADYQTLQGKDAVDALPKYQQDLNAMRQSIRGGLLTDQSRKIYDASALGFMGREIFAGAAHAATQNKQYNLQASNARLDADANAVAHSPKDETAFTNAEWRIKNEVYTTQASIRGWGDDDPQTKELIAKRISHIRLVQLASLARTEPMLARKTYNEHKDQLYGPDVAAAEGIINDKVDALHARIETERITEPLRHETENKPAPSVQKMLDEGERRAEEISPGNEMLKERMRQGILTKVAQVDRIKREAARDNTQIIAGAIIGHESPDGRKPTNEQELLALNPKVEAAWAGASNTEKRKWLTALAQNAKGDYAPTPESQAKYRELLGMRATAPEKFIDQDIVGLKMPERQKTELFKMQLATRVKQESDPRVDRAMKLFDPILAGLAYPITHKDAPTRYNKFRGGMQELIQDWVREHGGKQPTAEEVKAIGNGLLRETASKPGFFFRSLWPTAVPLFERPLDDEEYEAEIARPEYQKAGVPPPTLEEVRLDRIRRDFKELYGAKKSSPSRTSDADVE